MNMERKVADRELTNVVVADGAPAQEARREARHEAPRDGAKEAERPIKDVRATDIEPYTGLRYLSKLFKLMAVVLLLLLAAEVVTGLSTQGSAAIPTLLGEASRLLVFSGLLWGSGDLAHLFIDMGHDIRANRILMSRQVYHLVGPKGTARERGSATTTGSTTGGTVTTVTADGATRSTPPDML
jgi:hypothetical protein